MFLPRKVGRAAARPGASKHIAPPAPPLDARVPAGGLLLQLWHDEDEQVVPAPQAGEADGETAGESSAAGEGPVPAAQHRRAGKELVAELEALCPRSVAYVDLGAETRAHEGRRRRQVSCRAGTGTAVREWIQDWRRGVMCAGSSLDDGSSCVKPLDEKGRSMRSSAGAAAPRPWSLPLSRHAASASLADTGCSSSYAPRPPLQPAPFSQRCNAALQTARARCTTPASSPAAPK
jgi:hypothetical protein